MIMTSLRAESPATSGWGSRSSDLEAARELQTLVRHGQDTGRSAVAAAAAAVGDGGGGGGDGVEVEAEQGVVVTEYERPLVAGNSLVTYAVDDTPPWPLCVMLGFQHYLTAFGSTISVPLILSGPLCMEGDTAGLGQLMGTIFVVSGLATIFQSSLGIRLPIIQGATFSFMPPTFAILSQPRWQCPVRLQVPDNSTNLTSTVLLLQAQNGTDRYVELGSNEHKIIWQARLREVQGAILLASLTQVVLGLSGLVSVLLRYIGPLVVAPTVTLVGLALFDAAADRASQLWWIALLTLGLIVLFSQCLYNIRIPLPRFQISRKYGCIRSTYRLPVFELFPVLLAMAVSWLLCLALTMSGVLPSTPDHWGYNARTDAKAAGLRAAPWFRLPYPGQWGVPTVSLSAVLGMMAGVLASMIESVGDYYACARLSGAPPPPPHALNRGIAVEGFCCVLAGAFGSGNGTTSYSENVAAIGITKVASRRVVQVAGVLLVILGCLGKVGALFVSIPDPVVGGMFLAMFGMITAVGLSNVRYADMQRPRNMCVLGLSLFLGLAIPRWVAANRHAVSTGSSVADQIIGVLLSTSMFVGGFVGLVLDNLLPGTEQERGLRQWREEAGTVSGQAGPSKKQQQCEGPGRKASVADPYTLPLVAKCLRRFPLFTWLPFCPPVTSHRTLPPKPVVEIYQQARPTASCNDSVV